MNSYDLFQSISDIDDELIIGADNYKFNKKSKRLITFAVSLAAALALIILTGFAIKNADINILSLPSITAENNSSEADASASETSESISFGDNKSESLTGTEENTPSENNGHGLTVPEKIQPQTLAKATYPKLSPYPAEFGDDYETLNEMYSDWNEDIRKLASLKINTASVNNFSKNITAALLCSENNENKVISPLNIYMALSILAEITADASQQQLLDALGADSLEALRLEAQNLWKKNYRDDGYMKSILANSLWLNDSIDFKENTINTVAENYYASVFRGTMGSESYNKLLNDWISEQTDGLLTPSIEMTPQTVMMIASTLLFNTKWTNEFNPKLTQKGIFRSADGDKECEFMRKEEAMMNYYWEDNFSAVNLPLDVGGRMWFILPDEDTSVNDIFSENAMWELISADSVIINNNSENSKYLRVNLSVPKFDISAKTDLKDTLKELSITNVFDEKTADFSPIAKNSENLFIDKVTHEVRVKIDEEGVAAAAYTMLPLCGSSLPPDEIIDFVLDRPFAFVITLDESTPLFTGIVNNCE